VCVRAADPAVERHSSLGSRRLGGGQRSAEDRVRPEARLVLRPVERDERAVDRRLIGRVEPRQRLGDLGADVLDRLADAFSQIGLRIAVAQLDRLVLARRGARRNGCAADQARLDLDVDLDGGVAARVENLAGANGGDG
jgi:hypothetical protein